MQGSLDKRVTPTIADIRSGIQNEILPIFGYKKKIQKLTDDNWQDIREQLQIDPLAAYKEQPTCIEIIDSNKPCQICSLGNFTAVIGKAKSRKTFAVSLLIAACLTKDVLQEKIRGCLPDNQKRVILVDTEQSKADVSKVAKRIMHLAKTCDHLEVIGARILNPSERLKLIENIIYNTPDLGLLVIDGIRDLIADINSAEEATMISSKLLKWTKERNICIVTVLHQNKGDSNARGHLGTEIINKAETVISVEKSEEISTIKTEFVRGRDFKPFSFKIDEQGIPYVTGECSLIEDQGTSSKISPFNYTEITHKKVISDIFKIEERYRYNDFLTAIGLSYSSNGVDLSRNKRVDFAKFYTDKGFVLKKKVDGEKYPFYIRNQSV